MMLCKADFEELFPELFEQPPAAPLRYLLRIAWPVGKTTAAHLRL